MKRFKTIIVWSIFCLIIECSVLLYLDKVFFKHSSDFTVVEGSSESEKDKYEIDIPEVAKEIQSAYNGKYLSYISDDRFYLADSKTGETNEIITCDEDRTVLFAKWLPDRNRIIVAEKCKNDNNQDVISITNYDAKSKQEKKIKEICRYYKGMKVSDIATTTLSGVSYVGISRNDYNSTIYRIDINEDMKTVTTKVSSIGSMDIFPHKDMLIYEDSVNKVFYKYSNEQTKKINFGNKNSLKLLGLDSNGIVYMGELSKDNKITKILYGKLEENTASWTTKELDSPKEISDIHINDKQQILINEDVQGTVKNLSTNDNIDYEGKLIEIKDKVICSRNNNKIYLKKF